MGKGRYAFVLVLAFLAGLAGAYVLPKTADGDHASAQASETAYDRVMRTGTIRCGYAVWPPFLSRDQAGGKLSGIFYDYVEELGQALHLKIDWVEEEGWETFPAALASGRIDVMCGGLWPNSARARVIDFVHPILYEPVYAYARAGDTRFDNNPAAINNPSTTIATVDGATGSVIAAADFPKAKTLQLSGLTSLTDMFVNVVDKKADLTIIDAVTAAEYNAANPGKIHQIEAKTPLRVFGTLIAVNGGQDRLRRMLDAATDELLSSGRIEKIIASYEKFPGTLLRVGPLYQTGENGH